MARIAKSLDVLRSQINTRWPGRSKISDGWIGDMAHATRKSDHNPDAAGIVHALDITHDPVKGPNAGALAERLLASKDPRIDYIISNSRIGGPPSWTWRTYTGPSPHDKHFHVSVVDDPGLADDGRSWKFDGSRSSVSAPPSPVVSNKTLNLRRRMMEVILGYEAKIVDGKITVHTVDGKPEIAGITQVSQPNAYAKLKQMLDAGRQADVRVAILDFYETYTNEAMRWTDAIGIEFMLRDMILHRGLTGAAEILQRAVRVPIDGVVGRETRSALVKTPIDKALEDLRIAREVYEDLKYGKTYRQQRGQWQGLVNRWNKATEQAKLFQKEQGYTFARSPEGAAAAGVVAVGTGVAVTVKQDWSSPEIAIAVAVILAVAVIVFLFVRKARSKP